MEESDEGTMELRDGERSSQKSLILPIPFATEE